MNGYLSAMSRYARFRGRATRGEFWGFTLIAAVVIFVSLIVDAGFISGPESQRQVLAKLVILLHVLPTLAVSVRRLHDTGRSGWLLLFYIIPLIGLVLQIAWACQAGTSGSNQYGPDPLGGHGTQPDFGPMALTQPVARDVIAEIERLAQLKANGSLSEAEFQLMKAQALGRG